MINSWLKSVLPIAGLFSCRMLGLFLLIPVFTIYAGELVNATPGLIGIALGAYGLGQCLWQLPMGLLSDHYGRKPILIFGLLLLGLGSLVGALANSIETVIIARVLQGSGAIGSVLMALLADLTTVQSRTKGMAVIGGTIGLSFAFAMVISPVIASNFGLSGIFYSTLLLSLVGLLLLECVPAPPVIVSNLPLNWRTLYFERLRISFMDRRLQKMNLGIFFQHWILTATFYVLPLVLQQQVVLGHLQHISWFYLGVLLIAFVIMVPLIIIGEKRGYVRGILLLSVGLTACTQFFLAYSYQYWVWLCLFMVAYFAVFNVLEALLPSLISKQAQHTNKGTAMGIYSTFQFLGIFVGGILAGAVFSRAGYQAVFYLNSIVALVWLISVRRVDLSLPN